MHVLLKVVLLFLFFVATSWLVAEDDVVLEIEAFVIVAIDEVEVPSRQEGVIATLEVREGDVVDKADLLVTLDDSLAQLKQQQTEIQLQLAAEERNDESDMSLARKTIQREIKLTQTQNAISEIASYEAANELRILAATKAEDVAGNELRRATEAKSRYAAAVSSSEIEALTLAYERAKLERQQAEFERETNRKKAEGEVGALEAQRLAVEQAEIQLSQVAATMHERDLQWLMSQNQHEMAKLFVNQHRVFAPIAGAVTQLLAPIGSWVKVGQPVARLVRVDRLRAEGFVEAKYRKELLSNRRVELLIDHLSDETLRRSAEVVFVSPELDPVDGRVKVWVDFDNTDQAVLPGMQATLECTFQ